MSNFWGAVQRFDTTSLLSVSPNLNQDYDDKYTKLKTGSQAFTRLFYELDANRFINTDVLMGI